MGTSPSTYGWEQVEVPKMDAEEAVDAHGGMVLDAIGYPKIIDVNRIFQ